MRYLNKIVFINSASVKYAEVSIDGNVHFIGTQGVGKSTALRAILFFYNADKLKLGISKEKKGFDEYYFPYGNSYVIYEVIRETGTFCVIAFKSQGRVCFRFFDAAYDKACFIDNEGRAFETWDKTREAFANKVSYTRKIDRYEEYRDILYGNNKTISPEFRKYAIIESRQYQNIPRTIQNVFLNSKLDAEFIKQTIIMSLNEEDISIDLSNYTHHLKDFETQLNDIKKWTEKTSSGEIAVRKQADTVASTYAALRHLEREKTQLAGQLIWAAHQLEIQQPKLAEKLEKEEIIKTALQSNVADLDRKFYAKKEKITAEISVYEDKLKTAKRKQQEYENILINGSIFKGNLHFHIRYENFIPADDATVVGIENSESFRYVEKQKHLFPDIKPLFVCRYPSSGDLIKWLKSIDNEYIHFGDFDFAGIGIYLNEYKRYLNDKSRFYIPHNIEAMLESYGNKDRYDQQRINFNVKEISDENLLQLISLLHKYKKGLDQEVLMNFCI